ncbi:MAG: hypothetical protein OEU90_07140 [Gammaproteobacteria bacterium]|nr:hypothetical protein [Gammaproteobacteria bacterium]MDH3750567.1 hypothetical protein [Gammaproteobacteria bacterium]MDH3805232.1 hypothetical protein [Gammaproteobacteria bacterium]
MWEARSQVVPLGMQFQILQGRSQLSFRELFSLLENDTDFAGWYREMLASCAFEAFFWEFPPLTKERLDNEAEFVLIESASLARLRSDPTPFESQFALQHGADVITFPNLGGDALLIVPTPLGPIEAYPHLATFLRTAPTNQVRSLWKTTAHAVHEILGRTPRWLSTAGLGVSWLHLRLDTRPKYYSFAPYKTVA